MKETSLAIGEVARAADVPASTIRYYESIGLLGEPSRSGGKRRYTDAVLEDLAWIRWARTLGFTLAELRALQKGLRSGRAPSEVWRQLAERKLQEVRVAIRAARRLERTLAEALRCTCRTPEECTVHGLSPRKGR